MSSALAGRAVFEGFSYRVIRSNVGSRWLALSFFITQSDFILFARTKLSPALQGLFTTYLISLFDFIASSVSATSQKVLGSISPAPYLC